MGPHDLLNVKQSIHLFVSTVNDLHSSLAFGRQTTTKAKEKLDGFFEHGQSELFVLLESLS